MEPLLAVRGLTRRYGDRVAVHALSFEVSRAEAVGLLGVNGAGKSTTLRLLSGYLVPHAGTVSLAGFDLVLEPREVRRRVGYLAEGSPLPGDLRVERYLRFRAGIKELGRRAAAEVERVVERCGLSSERGTLIAHLSRGYRQRVGVADALLGDPPLLLLDEPSAALDPSQVRELRELLRGIARERTVILSSHALSEVEALCGRVLVLHRGELVADGAPGSLRPRGSPAHLSLLVRGAEAPLRAALAAVAGLGPADLRPLDDDLWRARAAILEGDPRPAAAAAVLAADLALLELRLETPSLEETFVSLLGEGPR